MSPLSEQDKQKIIEEERVRAEARHQFSQPVATEQKQPKSRTNKRTLLIAFLVFIGVLLTIAYWYISIPLILLVALWRWKKIKLPQKHKLYATVAIVALFAVINAGLSYAHRIPSISILEPTDNQSLQADKVVLKGKVSPSTSIVKIQGNTITIASNGAFEQTIDLPNETNAIPITAENGKKIETINLMVNRTFTAEEKAERERLAKERADQNAQKEADRVARQAQAQAEAEAQKPVQEYIANAKGINEALTKSFSTIGPLFISKPDPSLWTQGEITQVAGLSVVIEQSYEVAKKMTVPPQYKQFHDIWLQALKKYADAMPLMREGFDERSKSKLDRAGQLVIEGGTLLERSTAEFEKVK